MTAANLSDLLADRIAATLAARGRPLVVGLTGPQGSGKSTLASHVAERVGEGGLTAAVLALDDLYLPKADRLRLAREVHPLFVTRGVPGTHDVELGLEVLAGLRSSGSTCLPRFDKGTDDRLSIDAWRAVAGPVDVVLFEGWCVGARPQRPEALAAPVNDLERERDPGGVWRAYANAALAGPYQRLFAPIGFQILLRPPSFEVVLGWRQQQEHDLRAKHGAGQTDAELAIFVQHYERLTRHIDAEMPARADVVVQLGPAREVLAVNRD